MNTITLKDFMETTNYRISEGGDYGWHCYGPNAYSFDCWTGETECGWSASIVFDRINQIGYQVEVCDYNKNCAYRFINPDFKSAYNAEAFTKGIPANQAWDNINFIDLDLIDDFLEKLRAIVNDIPYDNRVQIEIDLDDAEIFDLMTMAHKKDITLNKLIANILQQVIDTKEIE